MTFYKKNANEPNEGKEAGINNIASCTISN